MRDIVCTSRDGERFWKIPECNLARKKTRGAAQHFWETRGHLEASSKTGPDPTHHRFLQRTWLVEVIELLSP